MMEDRTVNFYDVVKEAEKHFDLNGRGKGSGYTPFQRWINENENKYFPSGDRENVSVYFVKEGYRKLQSQVKPLSKFKTNSFISGSSGNSWTELGPNNANNVTSHYSQGIGRVECVYVDPNDYSKIYLGSRSGGFWRTSDEGANWIVTTDTMVATGVNTLDASPTNSDSVIINVRNASNGATHGVHISSNGGYTWNITNFNPDSLGWGGLGTSNQIRVVKYHPLDPGLILVGAYNGLYRSTDNLQTWTKVISGNITQIAFHPLDPDIIYVFDNNNPKDLHVQRSLDRGLNFTLSDTIPGATGSSAFLSTSADCNDCIWYATTQGVWRSIDTAKTFTFIINPNESCLGFAVASNDTSNMVYGYVDLEATTDGGATFNQVTWWSTGNANHDIDSNYVHADLRIATSVNGVFYVGTDGYLAKSVDGGTTWNRLNDGTAIREFYRVGVSQSDCKVNMVGSQDNGTSVVNSGGWLEWNGGDGMESVVHPANDDWMIGSWQYGNLQKTKDGGLSRQGAGHGDSGDWIAPLLFDPCDQMSVYAFTDTLYKSTDWGSNWTNMGLVGPSGNIQHAAIAENNSDILLASRTNSLWLSIDGGVSFSNISTNLPSTSSIADINFDPNDDSTVVIIYSSHVDNNNRVYISTDLGGSWTNISYNLSIMPARSVVIDHSSSSNIYVGCEIGVYYKSDVDTTWTLYNTDLPNVAVRELEIQWGSNTLRAATWGRGLYEGPLANRSTYPSINTVDFSEIPSDEAPVEGVTMDVNAEITYSGTLSSVYVGWSKDSASLDSIITMTNTSGDTWETSTPIPSDTAGVNFFVRVYAVGSSNDTTITYKYNYTTVPFEYCSATGDGSTTSDWIDEVKLNGMTNTSGKDAYGDFTDTIITLYLDSTYTIDINMNYHWEPDTTYAFIDFDHDSNFETDETIYFSKLTGSHESNAQFTVPSDAITTDTIRLRCRSQYWNSAPNACGSSTGEVEDYSIIIIDACDAITNRTWTGAVDSLWENASNWQCGIPDSTHPVIIPSGTTKCLISSGVSADCKTIEIETGADFEIKVGGSIHVHEP